MASAIDRGIKPHSSQSQFLVTAPDANVMDDKKALGSLSLCSSLLPLLPLLLLMVDRLQCDDEEKTTTTPEKVVAQNKTLTHYTIRSVYIFLAYVWIMMATINLATPHSILDTQH
jgi:hypothetical protein